MVMRFPEQSFDRELKSNEAAHESWAPASSMEVIVEFIWQESDEFVDQCSATQIRLGLLGVANWR
jgi:hypothetical protein